MASFNRGGSDSDHSQQGDEITDEMLIHEIAKGKTWAMEPMYDRYSRVLYTITYRMVADHQIAEDLLQEVFIAVFRRADSYSVAMGSVRSWLFSIAHNRAIDYLRAVKRRSTLKQAEWEEVDRDETTAQPDAWEGAWNSIQAQYIQSALNTLPPEQSLVIKLAYFHGWTHAEIAEKYGIPLGTVKARMRLGIKHLRDKLAQKGITEL
jgi:RNA polymerase sigma-70 factor (ECF subfamily)